jgi:trigger factor
VIDSLQKNPEAMQQLREPLMEEKVVDFIIELAKVTDKTVTLEELIAEPEVETPIKKKAPKKKSPTKKIKSNL